MAVTADELMDTDKQEAFHLTDWAMRFVALAGMYNKEVNNAVQIYLMRQAQVSSCEYERELLVAMAKYCYAQSHMDENGKVIPEQK